MKSYENFLPPLSTAEFAALKADIEANGIRDPVIEDEEGTILDGHNRVKIDPKAPRRVIKGLSPAEKEAFVFRCNFMRRNLSPDQKREVKKRMKETAKKLREEDAKKWTQAKVAEALGVEQNTVSRWLDDNKSNIRSDKANNPAPPDARVKLNKAAKEVAVQQVKAGKTQAQVAADFGVSQATVSNLVTKNEKRETLEKIDVRELPEAIEVLNADFRKHLNLMAEESIDLIFTDPPYDEESISLYGALAKEAKRILKPGGSMIAYVGHYAIQRVMELVGESLKFWWLIAMKHGGGARRFPGKYVYVEWKPLLWYVKGTRRDKEYISDFVQSKPPSKAEQDWQQSGVEASYYIEHLTSPGDLVLDPFCGSGTTLISAYKLNRKSIGIEVDVKRWKVARARIQRVVKDES